MSEPAAKNITLLLRDWGRGDKEALDQLVPLVYAELKRLSRYYLRRGEYPSPMQSTALINEAFVRLLGLEGIRWESRGHFFGIAARTMRNILVDRARRAVAKKRGGGERELLFNDEIYTAARDKSWELMALDDALESLAAIDPELGRLVELRFFGGLNVPETAEVLGVSPATVKRSWQTAKMWLHRELER